eukprot:jgi/Pico_ML_1/51168/g2248.t2
MVSKCAKRAQEAEWKKEQMQRRLAEPSHVDAQLDETLWKLCICSQRTAGYPGNQSFPVDFSRLHRFLNFHINNVGDPFVESKFCHTNTHEIEREVVQKGLQLAGVSPDELDSYWGYVTSGGTEGNLYGLHLARSIFPRAVVYYSRESHYSVPKSLSLLRLKNIMVRTLPGGAMDCEDLRSQLLVYQDRPAIIFANVGTTMKGAVDDISAIKATLVDVGVARHYIHCDAALHGFILPFLDSPPPWTFADGADSIAISGHKFLGCPVPCGLLLAKLDAVEHLRKSVDYIGSMDSTILGSRSGHAPLFMWYALSKASRADFRFMVDSCLAHADYAVERLEAEGLQAWRHPYSPIVVLEPRPPDELLSRWQLAPQGNMAHIITMMHVTCDLIDCIASDLGHWLRTGKKGLQLAGVSPDELDSYWGYVTSGGTEGNLYGLHLARSIFPRAVVYYSRESHYSVPKSLSLLRLKNIMVRTLPGGAMDCEDLRSQLLVYQDRPAIIFANVGTTMKGAVDDISAIKATLVDVGVARHYIHCDAALHGFILPFLDSPPPWTFADGADSIAISGHKFLGCPVPCGLLLAKLDAVEHLRKSVDYIGSMDSTILGSRSGHAPLFMCHL